MVNDNLIFFNNIKNEDVVIGYKEPLFYEYRCPVCGSRHIVRNGTYKRKVLYFKVNRIVCRVITIQKFLCKECNHSFHDEPPFLCKGSRFTATVLISILFDMGSIKSIAGRMDVSRSVVRCIKNRWRYEKRKIEGINEILNSYEDLVRAYRNRFGRKLFSLSTNSATYSP